MAICSDLDETPDAETYFQIIRFLTTTEETDIGQGVGLDVGNSIYFDMPGDNFSYWNTTEKNREHIRALIRSGHIDVLHSFGDLAHTRAHAHRALDELHRHGCRLKVWVDHAQAPGNFGADIMQGHGDEPGHPAYHADLTLQYGIRYIWRGRVTSVIGQNRPFKPDDLAKDLSLERVLTHRPSLLNAGSMLRDLVSTGRTFVKEGTKQLLSRMGNRKYQVHAANSVLSTCTLRDGSIATEFLRCNPHPHGVSCGDRGDRIHEVLSRWFLDRLVERRGFCVLYTHLGKLGRSPRARRFPDQAVSAFRLLAEYHRAGLILVTSTRRLLDQLSLLPSGASPASSTGTQDPEEIPDPSHATQTQCRVPDPSPATVVVVPQILCRPPRL